MTEHMSSKDPQALSSSSKSDMNKSRSSSALSRHRQIANHCVWKSVFWIFQRISTSLQNHCSHRCFVKQATLHRTICFKDPLSMNDSPPPKKKTKTRRYSLRGGDCLRSEGPSCQQSALRWVWPRLKRIHDANSVKYSNSFGEFKPQTRPPFKPGRELQFSPHERCFAL